MNNATNLLRRSIVALLAAVALALLAPRIAPAAAVPAAHDEPRPIVGFERAEDEPIFVQVDPITVDGRPPAKRVARAPEKHEPLFVCGPFRPMANGSMVKDCEWR